MTPFIIKYAKTQKREDNASFVGFQYDSYIESNIILGGSTRIIDTPNILIELTGSVITKTQTDPTRDEPTDR